MIVDIRKNRLLTVVEAATGIPHPSGHRQCVEGRSCSLRVVSSRSLYLRQHDPKKALNRATFGKIPGQMVVLCWGGPVQTRSREIPTMTSLSC